MRKLFSMLLISAVTLVSCSKDDNGPEDGVPCPVTGVELPQSSAATPIEPGETITIRGNGFASDCEIWLYAAIPSKAAGEGVRAEIEEVTATFVRFVTPSVSGLQTIELRQDGGAWKLGEMYCREGSDNPGGEIEILPKKLVKLVSTSPQWNEMTTIEYTYNDQNRLVKIKIVEDYVGTDGIHNETDVVDFDYRQNQIVCTYNSDNTDKEMYSLQENGRVEEFESNDKYASISYDANGFMTGFTETYKLLDGEEETESASVSMIFQNDCLVTFREVYNGLEYKTIEFIPDESMLNNLNLDFIMSDHIIVEAGGDFFTNSYLLGIAGKRSKYFPKIVKTKHTDGEYEMLKYEYKKEGEYLSEIKIYESEENSDKFLSTPSWIMTLFYEELNH